MNWLPALLAAAPLLPLPSQDAPPVFGVAIEVVRVEVLVTRGGQPVRGLTAENFELKDSGVRQTVSAVAFEEMPVDALLVLDMSGSVMGAKLEALREAAGAFLGGLSSIDRAALVTFHGSVRVEQPLTTEIRLVQLALDDASGGGSTALHDAAYIALRLKEPGRRTAVLLFSDGIDNVSWLSSRDVVAAAGRSDALVYAVDARGPGDRGHRFLRDVTKVTGGRVWRAHKLDELRDRFLDVLSDIRSRYVLTYTPTGVDTPGWHELEVKLRGRRGDVLARPAYFRPPRSAP